VETLGNVRSVMYLVVDTVSLRMWYLNDWYLVVLILGTIFDVAYQRAERKKNETRTQ